jgi:DNA-binding transcriptional LysR family regulator
MQLLRDIALFVEVVNTRSFTRAAANLDMPPSTLSRRISWLEREIGLKLLNRTTRRVDVTEAGAAYYARCAHLIDEARVAHEQLAETVHKARGTLRIACTPDFAMQYLAPVIVEYTRRHPEVSVELSLSSRVEDLLFENLDLALRIGHLPDSALVARRVATLQLGLYAAPSYFAVVAPPDHPEDLRQHMCLRMRSNEAGSTWRLSPSRASGSTGSISVPVTGRFVASSPLLIRQLTLLGSGIGVIDRAAASDDVKAGRLLPVLPEWRLPPVPLHMLTSSRLAPARVRLFGDLLSECLPTPALDWDSPTT